MNHLLLLNYDARTVVALAVAVVVAALIVMFLDNDDHDDWLIR